jgi:hypothetical protein
MTKKITVYLKDETVEILDRMAQFQEYRNYPEYQAHGLLIDLIVKALPDMSPKPFICL